MVKLCNALYFNNCRLKKLTGIVERYVEKVNIENEGENRELR